MRFFNSISQWETSYFGGYERILFEHPPVTVPKEIVSVLPLHSTMYIPYYTKQKLIDIFLHKVSLYGDVKVMLTRNTEKVIIENIPYLKVKSKGLESALKLVIKYETELGSLFEYYKSFILDTTFLYQLENEQPKQEGGGTDKDGEGKDIQDSQDSSSESDSSKDLKKESKSTEEQVNKFFQGLSKIVKNKTYHDFYQDNSLTNSELKNKTKFFQMEKFNKPCVYTPEEIKMSNVLVNLLDISFDPKSDRVNNLKTGKLDVSKIAEIPSGNTHVYYTIEENQSTRPFSVCILADESGSMCGRRIETQQTLLKVLYLTFSKVMSKDKIYIYGHSGEHSPEIRVYNDRFFDGFEHTIERQLSNQFCENYDGPVIERVYEKVRSQTSDNIIFISISDGYPSGKEYGGTKAVEEMRKIIEKCKRDGFVTVGIGVDCGLVKKIYPYHVVVQSLDNDKMIINNISTLVNRVVKTEFQS